jgi:hypothetical protein
MTTQDDRIELLLALVLRELRLQRMGELEHRRNDGRFSDYAIGGLLLGIFDAHEIPVTEPEDRAPRLTA